MLSDYILTDIHFHTNDSFDAYENINLGSLKIDNLINIRSNYEDKKIELICKTDHNVLNYDYFKQLKMDFLKFNIVILPGIELNMNEKVHWVFIFDDNELDNKIEGEFIGHILDKKISKLFNYSNDIGTIKERENAQKLTLEISSFLKIINDIGLNYLAIPHFNKSNGWFQQLKSDPNQIALLNYLINDNVIVGFETKNHNHEISKRILETQKHLSELIIDYENGILHEKEEIIRRKNHLNFLKELDDLFINNDTALLYGSDYHGKGDYCLDNLFYLKSERSFNGLKFALLDPYSRVFSEKRIKKYSKKSNYLIESIKFKNQEKEIIFGDGLNSIIGARGSGKSFLLSSIVGNNSKYNNSEIFKKIKIDHIKLAGGLEMQSLDEQYYDFISQKNESNKSENKNIYNLLSEAPYNFEKFEVELNKLYSKTTEKKQDFDIYFKNINFMIDNFLSLNKLRNFPLDLSIVETYNEFYKNSELELEVSKQFIDFEVFLNNAIIKLNKKKEKIIESNVQINVLKKLVEEIKDYKEVDDLNFKENYNQYFNILITFASNNIELIQRIEIKISRINKVYGRVKKINERLTSFKSNSELILNDNIKKLREFIKISISELRRNIELSQGLNNFGGIVSNETIYKFEQDEYTYYLKIEQKFDRYSLSKENFNEIFYKYRNLNYKKNILQDIFESKDFGKTFMNIYSKIDGRYSDSKLDMPKVQSDVYIKLNNEEYQNWFNLSPGQRSDVLLTIVLDTSSKRILIIDQPEDDLDNEMIYKTIVSKLRKLKLKKQIIVVTHNANVAITGDSDTVIICQNYNNDFKIFSDSLESKNLYQYNSINTENMNDTILNTAALILDGGKDALKKRVRKIGYKDMFFESEK